MQSNFDEGTIINNRYIVLDMLGKGGMGNVYLVRDTLMANNVVALKTIKTKTAHSFEYLSVFKQEFEIMTRLKHPNLINVFNFGYDGPKKTYYITMEYFAGQALQKLIGPYLFDKREKVINLMIKLLRAVSFIHSRKVVSRDIKPSNILVKDKEIKLMDFGISDIGEVDQKKVKGSLLYIAPEVISGTADHRIDIYSLGVVFLQMLTGRMLYQETKATSILNLMKDPGLYRNNQISAISNIKDENLKFIISKMIAYSKEDRYQNCSDIILDINKKLVHKFEIETDETKDAYVTGVNFTNREKEIGLLKARLFSVDKLKPMLVLVSEMGYGKSRLFLEFKKFAQMNNIIFLDCDCLKNDAIPYYIMAQLISQIMLYSDRELDKKYTKYLSMILKVKPDDEMVTDISNNAEMLNQSVVNYVLEFGNSTEYLCIIYINNLKHIDIGSLNILNRLLSHSSRTKKTNLRFFASAGKEECGSKNMQKIFNKKNLFEMVELGPFSLRDLELYMQNVFGEDSIDISLKDAFITIHQKVKGNPYFLSEFIRYALKRSIIDKIGSKWVLKKPIEEIEIPVNLKDILIRRTSPYMNKTSFSYILKILSMLRTSLSYNELCKLFVSYDGEAVLKIIQELERQEIIRIDKIGNYAGYRLSHDMLINIIQSEIKEAERKNLHKNIAEGLEIICSNRKPMLQELAYHYKMAGNKAKAVFYLKEAGALQKSKYFDINNILTFYTEALDLAKSHYGVDSIECASIYSEIGMIYYQEGEFEKAVTYLNLSEKISSSICEIDSREYTKLLIRQCITYIKLGDYHKALDYGNKALIKSLEAKAENSDRDSVTIANIYSCFIQIYMKTGKYHLALSYGKKIYDIYLKQFGEGSKEMIYALNLLGVVYLEVPDLQKAREYFETTMRLQNHFYGKYSIETHSSYNNLGLTLIELSHFKEAIKYLKINMKILKNFYKNPHLDMAKCYNNMGVAYIGLRENDKALMYYKRALKIRKKYYGEIHTRTAGCYNNIGTVYFEKKDYKKALEYYQRSLNIQKKIFGHYHSTVAGCFNNIGYVFLESDGPEKALEYFNAAHEIRLKIFSSGHPDIGNGYIALANVSKKTGNYEKAVEYVQKSIDIFKSFYKDDHEMFADSYKLLSEIYEDKKDYQKALLYADKALKVIYALFGSEHISYKNAYAYKNKLISLI